MLDLNGKTLIERVIETVQGSKKISKIVIATSNQPTDDILVAKLEKIGAEYFRGNLSNVLDRFYHTAKKYQANNIVRITADNPFMDGRLVDKLIQIYEQCSCDYVMFKNGVIGLSSEIFSFDSLQIAYQNAYDEYDKEHVTPYIKRNMNTYFPNIEQKYSKPEIRATIDTLEDYILIHKFYLYAEQNKIKANIDNFINWAEQIKK